MDGTIGWVALAVAVAGIGAGVWTAARRRERRRSEAIRYASLQLGLEFAPEGGPLEREGFSRLPLFGRGRGRRVRNVLRGGVGGGELLLFDYAFTESSGNSSTTHRQTVAAVRLPGVSLPEFAMSSESFVHRIGEWFGLQDIDFDAHPEFSRSYRLRGTDESAVREAFGPEVLSHFGLEKGWSLEGREQWLVAYRPGRRVAPEELPAFLQEATRIAGLFGGR